MQVVEAYVVWTSLGSPGSLRAVVGVTECPVRAKQMASWADVKNPYTQHVQLQKDENGKLLVPLTPRAAL